MLSVQNITNDAQNLVILLTKFTNNQLLSRAVHPHKQLKSWKSDG